MRSPTRTSRHLRFVFLAVLVPAGTTVGWLGARLFQQDRLLFNQRETERQAAAADAIAGSLSKFLTDAERQFVEGTPAAGTVLVRRTANGVEAVPRQLVAWMPETTALFNASDRPFHTIELLEFRGRAPEALAAYRSLTHSVDPGIRAAALLRSARVLRNSGRLDQALDEYRQLAQIEGIAFDDVPADLVARRAICDVLQQLGRRDALSNEAFGLERDFLASRWLLNRSTWELVADDLQHWTSKLVGVAPERLAFSAAIEWFADAPSRDTSGRVVLPLGQTRMTVLWRSIAGRPAALLIPRVTVDGWLRTAVRLLPARTIVAAIVDDRGFRIAGDTVAFREALRRAPAESGLPWTLLVAPRSSSITAEELRSRERLLGAALIALALFLGCGTYVLWRAVQREVAVAHLQSEFVSAVSHEFRTPLTSLRQAIELLQESDDVPQERRTAFYELMARNTERLRRLVESLLDFGRMEHARKPYDLRPVDVPAFVSALVDEFRVDPASDGRMVALSAAAHCDALVRADVSGLAHALWNLLDNAVKYSPRGAPVQVTVAPHPRGVAVAVTDRGLGVRPAERQEIFEKFVRGQEAIRLGITGTGVGLAIVRHIMDAHDGEIELETEEGRGSTFRIVLPRRA